MKKNLLALALIGALSMLGACSSDNDDNPGVSGSFAYEPISNATLEIHNAKTIDLDGEKALATVTTSPSGAFSFAVDPNELYVVMPTSKGLDNARIMDKANGTSFKDTYPNAKVADLAIFVPKNSPAQLNMIGLLATKASGFDPKVALTEEQDKLVNAVVSEKMDNVATKLALITSFTDTPINKETIAKGQWSANQEYAFQLVELATDFDPTTLANADVIFTQDDIDAFKAVEVQAKTNANKAAEAVGDKAVEAEVVSDKAIVKTYLFNTANAIIPTQINASEKVQFYLNGTAWGANASIFKNIATGTKPEPKEGVLIPATAINKVTIDPSGKGVSGTIKAREFKLDVNATGNFSVTIDAEFPSSPTATTFVFNLGDDNSNASIFTGGCLNDFSGDGASC